MSTANKRLEIENAIEAANNPKETQVAQHPALVDEKSIQVDQVGTIESNQNDNDQSDDNVEIDDRDVNQDDSQGDSETHPDWYQKRINQITAQKKSAEDKEQELRQELEELKAKIATIENPPKPEVTMDQLRAEKKRALEDSDFEYAAQIDEYMLDLKVKERENHFLTKNKEDMMRRTQAEKQWTSLLTQYGKFGLNDQNSKLFRLAQAYYANDPAKDQASAVQKAFIDLVDNGGLENKKHKKIEQDLKRERRKSQLGSGVAGMPSNNIVHSPTTEDYVDEFIKERAKQYSRASRGVS